MANVIKGDGGNNSLTGTDGDDDIYAYGGNDYLYGGYGYGNDRLFGGEGDDVLRGGYGMDILDGGNGVDTADYLDSGTGVWVDLRPGDEGWGHMWRKPLDRGYPVLEDSLSGIENVNGSGYND